MISGIQLAGIIASLGLAGFVLWLIRGGRLRHETALVWLLLTIVLLILSVRQDLLDWAAEILGVFYPPSLLLLGIILGGTFLAIHFSVVLSRLSEENKRLAQELAMLEERARRLEAQSTSGAIDGTGGGRIDVPGPPVG